MTIFPCHVLQENLLIFKAFEHSSSNGGAEYNSEEFHSVNLCCGLRDHAKKMKCFSFVILCEKNVLYISMLKKEKYISKQVQWHVLSHVLCAFLDSVLRGCRPAIDGEFPLWDAPVTACSFINQNKYSVQDDQYNYHDSWFL